MVKGRQEKKKEENVLFGKNHCSKIEACSTIVTGVVFLKRVVSGVKICKRIRRPGL
jgi:hypothetical protein